MNLEATPRVGGLAGIGDCSQGDGAMTCKQLVGFLEQYLAGDLAQDVRGKLESHLAMCGNCRRYLASYQNTVRLAADAAKHPDDDPPAEAPDDLVRAISPARSRAKR